MKTRHNQPHLARAAPELRPHPSTPLRKHPPDTTTVHEHWPLPRPTANGPRQHKRSPRHRADRHPPDSPPTPATHLARHRAVAVDAASTNAPSPQDHQSPDRAPATPSHLPEAPPTYPTNPSNPPGRKAPS